MNPTICSICGVPFKKTSNLVLCHKHAVCAPIRSNAKTFIGDGVVPCINVLAFIRNVHQYGRQEASRVFELVRTHPSEVENYIGHCLSEPPCVLCVVFQELVHNYEQEHRLWTFFKDSMFRIAKLHDGVVVISAESLINESDRRPHLQLEFVRDDEDVEESMEESEDTVGREEATTRMSLD